MAKILHIETATEVCSVAIGINGVLKSVQEINDGYSHAEKVEELMEKCLEESGLKLSDLDAVSVSKGPGSYTGLRIGVSLAKGLCYGLKIPLISIPSLESMNQSPAVQKHTNVYRVPLLDARRMEVYTAVYNPDNQVSKDAFAHVLEADSYHEYLEKGTVVFYGPAMPKTREMLSENPNAIFIENVFPSAQFMVEIGEEKFKKSAFEDVAYFEPFYLKDFVAGKPKKLL